MCNHDVFILIDLGASLGYINPKIVEVCYLQNPKFKNPWLVQLAIEAKRRVNAKVPNCSLEIGNQHINVEMNVLPLGSYDLLFGMDWLEEHWSLVNCKEKSISYLATDGSRQEIQRIRKSMKL